MKIKSLLIVFFVFVMSVASSVAEEKKEAQDDNMIVIPSGWFRMGTDWGEVNERPEHDVFVAAFKLDKFEVTSKDFAEFLNSKGNPDNKYTTIDEFSTIMASYSAGDKAGQQKPKGYVARPGFENFPANNVSWYGAEEYCKWKGKRLPTEAEWEKAARGYDRRAYPWGNGMADENKAKFAQLWAEKELNVMTKVDSLPEGASYFGVLNMGGNVWEWVNDWFRQSYCDFCDPTNTEFLEFAAKIAGKQHLVEGEVKKPNAQPNVTPRENPEGPPLGSFKVLRGGSWEEESGVELRASYRHWLFPIERYKSTGFRCAKSQW